ncbi:MAG: PEP-CTERM sorting domain-containing protein, partial [Haliscomenobacter sp.]
MKKFFTIIFVFLFSYSCWAGDIVFTLVNSDGNNGFAFVATTNISAGTVIYFTDNEWTGGNAGTAFNTGEGIIAYTVPVGGISEGTVVSIDTDAETSSNGGTVVETGSVDLLNGVEPVYAYYGTNSTTVTEILSVFRDAPFW